MSKTEKSDGNGKMPAALECLRCEWTWTPRKTTGLPARCPNCASPRWNVSEKPKKFCVQCYYEWTDKTANGNPVRCPACGTRHWAGPKPLKSIKPKNV